MDIQGVITELNNMALTRNSPDLASGVDAIKMLMATAEDNLNEAREWQTKYENVRKLLRESEHTIAELNQYRRFVELLEKLHNV